MDLVANLTEDMTDESRALSEPGTIGAIYNHYFNRIYTYVRYRVPDSATADDLTAQIFERMVSRIASYDPQRGPFAVWLWAIARNMVNDWGRSQRRGRWLSLETVREWMSPAPQPEERVLHEEATNALLAAVTRLSERERDLVALKFVAHMTNRRIAEMTGLSESNVAVILHRILRKLRTELTDEVNYVSPT